DDLATIIYTSGTTGRPKGVMLTHKNIVSTVLSASKRVPELPNPSRTISFLPACHIFERLIQYLYTYRGFAIYFAESIEQIGDNIREVKPHMFTAVPRLIEKVYDKIVAKGQELTGIKKALFFWAVKVGEEFDFDKGKKFPYSFKLKLARKLIFSKWREALGGELLYIVSGSAALQPRLQRVFNAATLFVLEGYGLTETSGVVSVNSPKDFWKIGTVGRPIDIVEVKIAEDGEILVKGPNIMVGYYKDPEKTAEVFTEEYFHTGDIGELDEDGVLKITDRKKEMFKTSGGKYVAPQLIENAMKQSPFIEQIMVVGEGQKLVAALVQPAFPFIIEWGKRHGIDVGKTYKEIAENSKVKERIMEEIEKYNKGFGKWEKIKLIELTPEEWSIEAGHLTPTMKLKRRVIKDIYKDLYNRIYDNV
ncbi:MAG TPA: long-chain fatty acid--CoA ligase, partial [Flavobacteriales bacterium]|nr:long-chain fatty acid--CoA ligase [Flavobacteriales bacterium]